MSRWPRSARECREVPHLAAQAVIDKAGYTDAFRKRLGYGMGISFAPDWGEGGIIGLNRGILRPLEPGMTFHLPPALRVYGHSPLASARRSW